MIKTIQKSVIRSNNDGSVREIKLYAFRSKAGCLQYRLTVNKVLILADENLRPVLDRYNEETEKNG